MASADPATVPATPHPPMRLWAILLAIAMAYVALGAILGFVQGGLAPILRSQGASLASMRWVYALFLPFGIAFLWAPAIDAFRWPWLGRRTGWIVPMQAVAVLAILAAAALPPGPGAWGTLMALGLYATLAAASMDLALDALTVEMVPPAQRATAAAAKLGGVSIGAVLGGGLLVAFYPQLAWHGALGAIAVLMALSGLPVLALVAGDRRLSRQPPSRQASLARTLRKPGMPRKLLRLSALVCAMLALFNFNRLLLVDLGVPLERIGSVLGTVSPLANAAACALAPLLLRRLPLRRAAQLLAAAGLAGAGTVWLGTVQDHAAWAMAGSVLAAAAVSALYVVLGGLILEWAAGPQAATDYALLYGLGRLLGTASLMALPGLAQQIGWPVFQGGIVLSFAAAFWYFLRLFPARAGTRAAPL